MPRPRGSLGAPAPAEVLWAARDELAAGRGNSKPVASGSRARPWLGTRQPGNQLLSNFLAIQRACSEPQFHFPPPSPLPASQPKRQRTPEAKIRSLQKHSGPRPPKLLSSEAAHPEPLPFPHLHLGAGRAEETCLDQPEVSPVPFAPCQGKVQTRLHRHRTQAAFSPA